MTITLNGEPHQVEEGATLADLLASLGRAEDTLAVALNLRVVPRDALAERRLADEDRVDIVTAVGGG